MINDHNFHDVNVNVMIVIFWCEYHRVKSNQKYKCCRSKSAECRVQSQMAPISWMRTLEAKAARMPATTVPMVPYVIACPYTVIWTCTIIIVIIIIIIIDHYHRT